ncbi:YlmC/YmxH family sporulation protein [Pseudalkalibacillus caeni]|uniref:YlmC/YmxH family sporulation protein n=1 Tax=Exobacillus caeni TaxID=2574798 RepID=A0A5R9F4F1_9BACL|nr:YlmC/YmxH family sporulation protein [Pseudalkalibacillus caeni]TLS37379.1 YlmC/YmxH family sporulation protein [Pseudalkalibacillus caeni]
MRLSQLSGKEIVDISRGERLGVLGQTDLLFDETTGSLKALIIPQMSWLGIRKKSEEFSIPWNHIETIGKDIIIIQNPYTKP